MLSFDFVIGVGVAVILQMGLTAGGCWYVQRRLEGVVQRILDASYALPSSAVVIEPTTGQARCSKCGLLVAQFVRKANGVNVCKNCQKGNY